MTNLLWPGDHRAEQLLTDTAVWEAMLRVETAWLHSLADNGLISHEAADCNLTRLVDDSDREAIASVADDGGNPIIPLVALLRERAPEAARRWIHRGLTSQDVLDTALMLTLRDALCRLRTELGHHVRSLAGLTAAHRHTPMPARTLTQPAIPITFGVKAASWLSSVCDAASTVSRVRTPVQIGGAAGTLAAPTEMAALVKGDAQASATALAMLEHMADNLELDRHMPWHTSRRPITAIGDAFVGCTDAWARIASDIVTLNRPEIGELSEPSESGRGGSSTMPEKHNPVLSVLIRRAALTAPPMAAVLHSAAAFTNDERADGAWHAEWDTVRILGRRTMVAATHATDLIAGLRVDSGRMAANLATATMYGEQDSIAALIGRPATSTYFGASVAIIDDALDRSRQCLEDLR